MSLRHAMRKCRIDFYPAHPKGKITTKVKTTTTLTETEKLEGMMIICTTFMLTSIFGQILVS